MSTPLRLSIQTGTLAGQTFSLQPGTQTLGRSPDNQIVIAESTVSKQHAQITVQSEGTWIRDLGSSNGTFVNGQRISESTWLKPGDTLQIGTSVVVAVEKAGGAAAGQPSSTPPWIVGLVALAALLLVGGLAAGGWLLFSGRSATPTALPTAQVIEPDEPDTPVVDSPALAPIIDFTASKMLVPLGECLTLRWNVNHAQEVRLDGELIPAQGQRSVCPQENGKIYRLTVLSLDGQTGEESIAITVPPTPPPPPGVSVDFSADQTTVDYGRCTALRWSIENAEAIRLDGEKVGPQGSKEVCPTEPDNAYQLLVAPLEGDLIEQSVIIKVPPTPLPPSPTPEPTPTTVTQAQTQAPVIDKLIADQTTLNQSGCTTLRWTVRNAQSVQLNGGEIGSQSVGNQGARRVCPPQTSTTYTLIASNAGGSVQTSLTLAVILSTPTPVIVVVPQPQPQLPQGEPVISISATLGYIDGDKRCFTLQGFIENVREAYLSGGKYNNAPLTGPSWTKKVCHKNTNTYRMTAVLYDGSTKSVSITREGP